MIKRVSSGRLLPHRLKAVKVSENCGKTHTPIRVMAMAATMLEIRPVSSQMIPREVLPRQEEDREGCLRKCRS